MGNEEKFSSSLAGCMSMDHMESIVRICVKLHWGLFLPPSGYPKGEEWVLLLDRHGIIWKNLIFYDLCYAPLYSLKIFVLSPLNHIQLWTRGLIWENEQFCKAGAGLQVKLIAKECCREAMGLKSGSFYLGEVLFSGTCWFYFLRSNGKTRS